MDKAKSLISVSERARKQKLTVRKVSKLKPAAEIRLDFTGYSRSQRAYADKVNNALKLIDPSFTPKQPKASKFSQLMKKR